MNKVLSQHLLEKIQGRKNDIQNNLLNWGKKNYRDFPWRSNRTPYSVLVCEILLRRTTAQAVNNIYEDFLNEYPTISDLNRAKESDLVEILSKIGYHKKRARIFKEISKDIIEIYGGDIPDNPEELLELPQVGYYIANSVLTFGFGFSTSIVDTNVERILKRVFKHLNDLKTLRLVREVAVLLSPSNNNQMYNYSLLDLGGLVCKPNKPLCESCPLISLCDYPTIDL